MSSEKLEELKIKLNSECLKSNEKKIIVIKCSFCQNIQGSVPTYFHIFSKDSKFVECITFVIQISVLLHSYIPVLFFRQQINRNFYKNLDHVNTAFKNYLAGNNLNV